MQCFLIQNSEIYMEYPKVYEIAANLFFAVEEYGFMYY